MDRQPSDRPVEILHICGTTSDYLRIFPWQRSMSHHESFICSPSSLSAYKYNGAPDINMSTALRVQRLVASLSVLYSREYG